MMRMLLDKLDRGAISVYLNATEAEFAFSRMSPLSTWIPSQITKLGIGSPPSIIARMSKSSPYHNHLSVSDSLHGFLKPILSHMGTCANSM